MMNTLPHYSHNCELVWMFQSPEVYLKEYNMYIRSTSVVLVGLILKLKVLLVRHILF